MANSETGGTAIQAENDVSEKGCRRKIYSVSDLFLLADSSFVSRLLGKTSYSLISIFPLAFEFIFVSDLCFYSYSYEISTPIYTDICICA